MSVTEYEQGHKGNENISFVPYVVIMLLCQDVHTAKIRHNVLLMCYVHVAILSLCQDVHIANITMFSEREGAVCYISHQCGWFAGSRHQK